MNLNCFVFSLIEQMCCLLNNSKKTPLKSVLKFIFTAYERKVNESITTFHVCVVKSEIHTLLQFILFDRCEPSALYVTL